MSNNATGATLMLHGLLCQNQCPPPPPAPPLTTVYCLWNQIIVRPRLVLLVLLVISKEPLSNTNQSTRASPAAVFLHSLKP